MARSLTFTYKKASFDCTIHKVERTKLYGSGSIKMLDMDGNKCELATLLDDGETLVPYGGTASGYINPDGEWVCTKEITRYTSFSYRDSIEPDTAYCNAR